MEDDNDIFNMNMSSHSNNSSSESDDDQEVKVPWASFIALLINASIEQLENVKSNIKKYYKLNETEIKSVEEAFFDAGTEFEHILQINLRKIVENDKFNESHAFMYEFTDLSNFILEQIIETALSKVDGKLQLPTKWYKQVMRQKVVRQQVKIATNLVEVTICDTLSVCKNWWSYTDYLVEWIRTLLNLSAFGLKNLFGVMPNLLDKHMHTIKSNIKFKKTVKFIVSSDHIVQRDTLDYLDEVLTDKDNVVKLVPESLKKGATLLIELFELIDDNYDLNDENEKELEIITKNLTKSIRRGDSDIKLVLESILLNVDLNLKIWPLDVQNKIDQVWSKIIRL